MVSYYHMFIKTYKQNNSWYLCRQLTFCKCIPIMVTFLSNMIFKTIGLKIVAVPRVSLSESN